jgi:phage terminase small subunit
VTEHPLQPPGYLNAEGRAIWADYLREIMAAGTAVHVNGSRLLELVTATQRHNRAAALLAQTDILVDRDGTPAPNPALAVQAQAASAIERLRKEFGLTRRQLPPQATRAPHATPQNEGRWCGQHGRRECTSSRSRGRGECHGPAVLGFPRCRQHLGLRPETSPEHLAAVEQRANPLAGEPMDITPLQALMWRVRVLAGEVARLDAVVAAVAEEDLVFGVISETEEEGDTPARRTTRGARLSQWLVLRESRERMLHSACESAIRAGVQEQVVDLLKQEAATLHRVLVGALGRLGIEPDDPRIPVVLPEVIRELTA